MVRAIAVDSLSAAVADPGVRLVDARPTAAFNGWRLGGEARGGHIPGAVAFPRAWAEGMFDPDLAARLADKGLTPNYRIVVYGNGDGDGATLAERLEFLGYHDVAVLTGGLTAWAEAEQRELARLPGFRQLVHPRWLQALLSGEGVDEAPQGPFALYHVNYGVPEEYAEGHLPGAFHLDTNRLEASEDWNRRSPQELEEALLDLGITRDTTVIVYGHDTATDPREQKPGRSAGQIAATRAAAILLYSGVEDVRLLDGGMNAWRAAGYPVETEIRRPTPVAEFGTTIPAKPGYFIDFEEAVELLADPGGVLVSIRSLAEHLGKTSGYNYIEQTGDIPGAVWGNCGSDAYHMQHYRNVDNTMRDFNEVAANWADVGIAPDKRVAFYCGTGWRASETFFYAHLMGWPRVSIYDGGWFEWVRRTSGRS